MNKKIIALMMAMVLCLTCVSALAAGSKTTNDVVYTSPVTEEAAPVVAVVAPTAETQAVIAEVEALADQGKTVAEYFGVQAAPEAANLKVDELVPAVLVGEAAGTATATATLNTAATYTEEDNVVVLIGFMVDGEMVWTELSYTIVDGKLVVEFPEEILKQLDAANGQLAVLSTKAN